MTGDEYRDRVRAMTAVEHFGTDYQPIAAERTDRTEPTDVGTGAPECCRCDGDPGVFAVFAFAVLAMHRPLRRPRSLVSVCSCGRPAATCPVRSLADGLLFAADPGRDAGPPAGGSGRSSQHTQNS